MIESQSLLKQDARGRVRVPSARREGLLDEFERSGVSGAKFAEMVGVKYSTFAAWLARRKRARLGLTRAPLRLVEAVADAEAKSAVAESGGMSHSLQVHLAGGVRFEISEERQLKWALALLKVLKAARPC